MGMALAPDVGVCIRRRCGRARGRRTSLLHGVVVGERRRRPRRRGARRPDHGAVHAARAAVGCCGAVIGEARALVPWQGGHLDAGVR